MFYSLGRISSPKSSFQMRQCFNFYLKLVFLFAIQISLVIYQSKNVVTSTDNDGKALFIANSRSSAKLPSYYLHFLIVCKDSPVHHYLLVVQVQPDGAPHLPQKRFVLSKIAVITVDDTALVCCDTLFSSSVVKLASEMGNRVGTFVNLQLFFSPVLFSFIFMYRVIFSYTALFFHFIATLDRNQMTYVYFKQRYLNFPLIITYDLYLECSKFE